MRHFDQGRLTGQITGFHDSRSGSYLARATVFHETGTSSKTFASLRDADGWLAMQLAKCECPWRPICERRGCRKRTGK